jgi:hypothetical protein
LEQAFVYFKELNSLEKMLPESGWDLGSGKLKCPKLLAAGPVTSISLTVLPIKGDIPSVYSFKRC